MKKLIKQLEIRHYQELAKSSTNNLVAENETIWSLLLLILEFLIHNYYDGKKFKLKPFHIMKHISLLKLLFKIFKKLYKWLV